MEPRVAGVPPGARLLHIGIPKTGTTALQRAAADNRAALLTHGVCYPGRTVNHREAVCALMGRRLGWAGAGDLVPTMKHWNEVLAELQAHPDCRGFLSHEFASESTEEQARRFAAALAPLHVVITLRGFAQLLGSSWQQYLKAGRTRAFEPWLQDVLADPPRGRGAAHFYRRNDQGRIVRRWVDVLGPDRVVVVVVDKNRPSQLTDAFEHLLGLPPGLLVAEQGSGFASNRALSWPEAELLRSLNARTGKSRLSWPEYDLLVRGGGITRLLESRRPASDEPTVQLPTWAAEQASRRAQRYAEEVAASGCRVVGDLATLSESVPTAEQSGTATQVPIDAAVELATGLISAALGRGPFFETEPPVTIPALQRVARWDRGRRWLELARRNPGASPADLLVVAVAAAARAIVRRG